MLKQKEKGELDELVNKLMKEELLFDMISKISFRRKKDNIDWEMLWWKKLNEWKEKKKSIKDIIEEYRKEEEELEALYEELERTPRLREKEMDTFEEKRQIMYCCGKMDHDEMKCEQAMEMKINKNKNKIEYKDTTTKIMEDKEREWS